ncbi:MAG: 4'-phosphopantetheinyl transferase superfamily protein [Candidatus Omnitrophica bacterium]|nr:4'-phosphopantetheinyl transferase superfamily protein [Candidatus Omnitrophota bacterium]
MFQKIFPQQVLFETGSPEDLCGELYPEEAASIQKATKKRQKEFTSTRLLAKKLLKQYHVDHFPILMGDHREPLWPEHLCGTISHCPLLCAVAVAEKKHFRSLGCDIEIIDRVDYKIHTHICQDKEWDWITLLPLEEQQKYFALIFSAKECFFKWQFPLSHHWLNFKDTFITIDVKNQQFTIQITASNFPHNETNLCATGQFKFTDKLVLTGIAK